MRSVVGWISEDEVLFNVIEKPIYAPAGGEKYFYSDQAVALLNVRTGESRLLSEIADKHEALASSLGDNRRLALVQAGRNGVPRFAVLDLDYPDTELQFRDGYVVLIVQVGTHIFFAARGPVPGFTQVYRFDAENGLTTIANLPTVGDGRSRMSRISLALDPVTKTISVVSEVPPLNLDAKTKMVAVSTFRASGEQVRKTMKFRVPQLRANSLSLMKSIVTKHGLLIVDEGWIGLVSKGKVKNLSKTRFFAPDALRCS